MHPPTMMSGRNRPKKNPSVSALSSSFDVIDCGEVSSFVRRVDGPAEVFTDFFSCIGAPHGFAGALVVEGSSSTSPGDGFSTEVLSEASEARATSSEVMAKKGFSPSFGVLGASSPSMVPTCLRLLLIIFLGNVGRQRRVEIGHAAGREQSTDVRVAMSGTADPETGVRISVRAPKPTQGEQYHTSLENQISEGNIIVQEEKPCRN